MAKPIVAIVGRPNVSPVFLTFCTFNISSREKLSARRLGSDRLILRGWQ